MRLHEDFLSNAAGDMLKGLRAAIEVVAGAHPRNLEPEKLRAAWQIFFLAVPMVSTTFASVGRMFAGLGAESLGWLLIDEAGQAPPQYAVGGIWRAQRVIAVGDPLQLQPVVTMPRKAQRDIAAAFGVSPTWIPPRASVQTLADRMSRDGTALRQGEESVWVSMPLTVHRRCDDPMFSLCNEMAYDGMMVSAVHRRLDDPEHPDLFDGPDGEPRIPASQWLDMPATTPGTHLQDDQIARLCRLLDDLGDRGVAASEMIAISPFRVVADKLESLARRYPGLRGGTIHTAQGREADVVFLVLGGAPGRRPGPRRPSTSSTSPRAGRSGASTSSATVRPGRRTPTSTGSPPRSAGSRARPRRREAEPTAVNGAACAGGARRSRLAECCGGSWRWSLPGPRLRSGSGPAPRPASVPARPRACHTLGGLLFPP